MYVRYVLVCHFDEPCYRVHNYICPISFLLFIYFFFFQFHLFGGCFFFIISSHGLVLVLVFEANWNRISIFFGRFLRLRSKLVKVGRDQTDYEDPYFSRLFSIIILFGFWIWLECAGSVGSGHWRPVEESTLVVGSTIGTPRFLCSGQPGHSVEEARSRQQWTGCLRGAHEGLCQRYRSKVLPRRQPPRRK